MEELFYIICTNEEQDWWQLRYKPNHYVVSCTTGKDRILQCLYNIVVKHRSGVEVKHLMRNLYIIENKESIKKKEEEYNLVGDRYAKEVEEVIEKALHDNLVNNKKRSPLTKNLVKNKSLKRSLNTKKDITNNQPTKKDLDDSNKVNLDTTKKDTVKVKKPLLKNRLFQKPIHIKKDL